MRVLTQADPVEARRLLAAGEFVWIDLAGPSQDEVDAIGEVLGLHPLAVEDSREFGQHAKVDRYGASVLLVFFSATSTPEGAAVPVEVHLHSAEHFLLTVRQSGTVERMDDLHAHVAAHPPRPQDATVYRVLDALVAAIGPALEGQQAALDELGDAILRHPRAEQLERLVALRRSSAILKRRLVRQHELFDDLEAAVLALPGIENDARPYLRDVGDRVAHAAADAVEQAVTLDATTDTYFNANANRLTVLSERLGVIATILLPLTFVTSFFGQNFGWLVGEVDTLRTFLLWGVGGLIVPLGVALGYLLVRRRESPRGRRA